MNTDKIWAESIAKEYAPKDNSKIIAIKKLDSKAKLPATIFTYTFGIMSVLVFGTGMCLAMQVIGNGLASTELCYDVLSQWCYSSHYGMAKRWMQ